MEVGTLYSFLRRTACASLSVNQNSEALENATKPPLVENPLTGALEEAQMPEANIPQAQKDLIEFINKLDAAAPVLTQVQLGKARLSFEWDATVLGLRIHGEDTITITQEQ